MKTLFKGAIFALLSLLLFFACKKSTLHSELKNNTAHEWLKQHGENLKAGTLNVKLSSGLKLTGILNWDSTHNYEWNGNSYIDVPYYFKQDRYFANTENTLTTGFTLVLKKLPNNNYQISLRTTTINTESKNVTANTAEKTVLQTYTTPSGGFINGWLAKDGDTQLALVKNSYTIVPQNTGSSNNITVNTLDNCQIYSTTTYGVECWYETEQDRLDMHATCLFVSSTFYTTICSPVNIEMEADV